MRALCAVVRRLQVAVSKPAGGRDGHTYGIIDAKPDAQKKVGDGALNLAGMRAEVDPPQEWKQIFNEVWRQERDYFFEAVHERRGLGKDARQVRASCCPTSPTVTR